MGNTYDWRSTEEEPASPVEKAADTARKLQLQGGNLLRGSFYTVCLVAIILVEILRRFVSGSINKSFSWNLLFAALVTSLTTLLTFYMFFPSGKGAGMLKKAFIAAQKLKDQAVAKINAGLKTAFRTYCQRRSEDEAREEMETAFERLADHYVTKDAFEDRWRLASRLQLLWAVLRHKITWGAMRQILRCRRPFAAEPYIPDHFTAGVSTNKQKKMLRGDAYETRVLLLKPLSVVVLTVAQSVFTIAITGAKNGLEVFLAIVMSVFQICLAAFSGYLAGGKVAEHLTAVNLVKAGFMMDFLEEQGVPLTEFDEMAVDQEAEFEQEREGKAAGI